MDRERHTTDDNGASSSSGRRRRLRDIADLLFPSEPGSPIISVDSLVDQLQKSIAIADSLLALPDPIPSRPRRHLPQQLPSTPILLSPSAADHPLISPKRLPDDFDHPSPRRPTGIALFKCHSAAKDIIRDLVEMVPERFREVAPLDMALASVVWTDHTITSIYDQVLGHQRVNHLPQMHSIVTKSSLARLLNLGKRVHGPGVFDYFPASWELPRDRIAVKKAMRASAATFILKPSSGLQGRHILLTRKWDHADNMLARMANDDKGVVVQSYITRPMLLNGFKWDMRIYVLIESLTPLRVVIFKEGLARFATEPYAAPADANLSRVFMHLTNYSLNKGAKGFRRAADGTGSKRRISTVLLQLRRAGHDLDLERFWRSITDIVVKTVLCMWPSIWGSYQAVFAGADDRQRTRSFHLLGFDILMDSDRKLWLLEVNSCPSLTRDTSVDADVKNAVLQTTLAIVRDSDPSTTTVDQSDPGSGRQPPPPLKPDEVNIRERGPDRLDNRSPGDNDKFVPDSEIIDIVPENDERYAELCLFKVPLTGARRPAIDRWRDQIDARDKHARRRHDHDDDAILSEQFLVAKAMKNMPATIAPLIQDEMRKEVARLLGATAFAKCFGGTRARHDDALCCPPATMSSDELIADSDMSIWRLFLTMVSIDALTPISSSSRFLKLLSTCHLTSTGPGFQRSDADLLFQQMTQTTSKHSTSIVSKSPKNRLGRIMTFDLFVEAFVVIALRQYPDLSPPDAVRKLVVAAMIRARNANLQS